MSRVIKFRVWHKNKMSRGFPFNEIVKMALTQGDNFEFSDVDKCDFMRFTGILDKNKKEIYESDIMLHSETGEVVHVKWSRGRVCFELTPIGTWSWVGFEVIGNIHENPELLEGL